MQSDWIVTMQPVKLEWTQCTVSRWLAIERPYRTGQTNVNTKANWSDIGTVLSRLLVKQHWGSHSLVCLFVYVCKDVCGMGAWARASICVLVSCDEAFGWAHTSCVLLLSPRWFKTPGAGLTLTSESCSSTVHKFSLAGSTWPSSGHCCRTSLLNVGGSTNHHLSFNRSCKTVHHALWESSQHFDSVGSSRFWSVKRHLGVRTSGGVFIQIDDWFYCRWCCLTYCSKQNWITSASVEHYAGCEKPQLGCSNVSRT